MERPSVLIISEEHGHGIYPAAKVIADDLQRKGFNPIIFNIVEDICSTPSTSSYVSLKNSPLTGPTFYKWLYYGTNKLNLKGLDHFSGYLLRKRLMNLIAIYRPIFIISTTPHIPEGLNLRGSSFSIPTYAVITEYCVNSQWLNRTFDHYFVSSFRVKKILMEHKINKATITVSGVPIRSQFKKAVDKTFIFQKYLISPHKKIITLLAGGSRLLKQAKDVCSLLLQNPSHQIVAICGKNETLYERLLPLAIRFPDNFRVFDHVDDVHELFAVSSCIITKPNGVHLTEAAALKTPLILFNPALENEVDNAKYFTEIEAGLVSNSPKETFELVHNLTRSKELSASLRDGTAKISPDHSASIITEHAIKQLQTPCNSSRIATH
ncbi:MGDG synthase family glycosyltransferase [Neobacillus sp. LXY-4]|uniref:MGDG synthase family glycosyltransferase n=1 Tax=Neobacillus sp. LXY-4 TaxID=3379826 RepID=UPI003EDEA062